MRRNCPQCGVDQVVADEKLNAGLIFLKCHQCDATSALQGRAAQQLSRLAEKPLRTPVAPVVFVEARAGAEPKLEVKKPSLPPVPDFLKSEKKEVFKEVFQEAEPQVFETSSEPILIEVETESQIAVGAKLHAMARGFAARTQNFAPKNARSMLPLSLALICFASGGYLLRTARVLRAQGEWLSSPQNSAPVVSDLVPTSQVASEAVATAPAEPPAPAPANVVAEARTVAPAPAPAREINRQPAIVSRSDRPMGDGSAANKVEVLASSAVLRAGPGLHFSKVGTARAELQLWVKGTFDDWIEVRTGGKKTAWIRSDLVKPLKQVALQEAQP